jgi:multidrug efflux pump subunit AcrB
MIFMTLLIMFNSFRQTLIILTVIPLSVIGAVIGHKIMGMNFSMPSIIGILGLSGVVINNGVVMLEFIRNASNFEDLLHRASLRLRPIIITSLTTFIGLSTLIFFATGQAVILQPISVSLGYGLLWGTVLNLIYLPAAFAMLNYNRLSQKGN